LRLQESILKFNDVADRYEVVFGYVVDGRVVPRTEDIHLALVWQTIFGTSGKPSYFMRFTPRNPGTGRDRREQLLRFAGALWEQIGPILEGRAAARPEPPPTAQPPK
jgi:hypothetical protein